MREESAFSGKSTDTGATGPIVERSPSGYERRIPVLDGWRATSILFVLGGHLLPLGPHWLQLNAAAAAAGMALFFTLSGFLITQFLAGGMSIPDFLARRLARILPLSWLAITMLLLWHRYHIVTALPIYGPRYDLVTAVRNYLFVANLPPTSLLQGGEHLWSLCVEMQFYVSIALLCLIFGRRGLYLIPVVALAVTTARIVAAQPISIVTWHRIDEILAGGIIALVYSGWFGERAAEILKKLPVWPFGVALLVCSHPDSGPLQYLRPYAASFLVGATLSNCPARLHRLLASRPMAYVAEISYALYVIHGMLSATWLGAGDKTVKYLKRPLLFLLTFALAHASTRYYEQPITRAVKRWTRSRGKRAPATTSQPLPSAASRLYE
ncbi:MAG: acyltransferase family protein [Sphingomicrobium sp.]